jgi:inosine-uridine nucleoside N-ribohydrolase
VEVSLMPKKIILDLDPGVDDALAVLLALYHPEVELVAVTSVGGNVPPGVASRNVSGILGLFDPPRWPRVGVASLPDDGLPVEGRYGLPVDCLEAAQLKVAELRSPHPAEKVICEEVRAAPGQVTVVALGPLTNIARAFIRDPELPSLINRLWISGGSVSVGGNITPAAEFNIYCDPKAARYVFRSHASKVLVPLDVTNKVLFTFDHLLNLPPATTRVGDFLRTILPPAFRSYREKLGIEGIHIHDTLTLMAAIQPDLLEYEELAGDVEIEGELCRGATVFDRRRVPEWQRNVTVARKMESDRAIELVMSGLDHAALRAGPALP